MDLSSLYVDITKDRMYCDAPGSPRRRATQAVMHHVYDALVRLLAPILAFTAEEAWSHFGKRTSVHVERFPSPDSSRLDSSALVKVEALLRVRTAVSQAIEAARQRKELGNALEAHVRLQLPEDDPVRSIHPAELEEFLILSDLELAGSGELAVQVNRTGHRRCGRCWRHRPAVGQFPDHPELCDRCVEVVRMVEVVK